jgi:hypothetical protein
MAPLERIWTLSSLRAVGARRLDEVLSVDNGTGAKTYLDHRLNRSSRSWDTAAMHIRLTDPAADDPLVEQLV